MGRSPARGAPCQSGGACVRCVLNMEASTGMDCDSSGHQCLTGGRRSGRLHTHHVPLMMPCDSTLALSLARCLGSSSPWRSHSFFHQETLMPQYEAAWYLCNVTDIDLAEVRDNE